MVSPPDFVTGSYFIDALLTGNWAALRSTFSHMVLPVVCLAIISAAPIIKHTRAIALEVLSSDAIRYARAFANPGASSAAKRSRSAMFSSSAQVRAAAIRASPSSPPRSRPRARRAAAA